MSETVGNDGGKYHALCGYHAACSPNIVLSVRSHRPKDSVPVTDLCGRCFPGVARRRRLKVVR